jgi:hypothetical protein
MPSTQRAERANAAAGCLLRRAWGLAEAFFALSAGAFLRLQERCHFGRFFRQLGLDFRVAGGLVGVRGRGIRAG